MGLVISFVTIMVVINFKRQPERQYWVQNLSTASSSTSSISSTSSTSSERVFLEPGNANLESGYDTEYSNGIQNPAYEADENIELRITLNLEFNAK